MSHSASSKKTTMMLFTLRGSSGSASAPLHTPWSWPGSPWQAAPSGKTSLRRPLAFENTFCQLWVLTEIAYFASQVAKTTSSQASSKTGSAWTINLIFCHSSGWWKDYQMKGKITFCHSQPSSQKQSEPRRAAYWAPPHIASRTSATTKPTMKIERITK